jgi:parallel beta-helix repeat protein
MLCAILLCASVAAYFGVNVSTSFTFEGRLYDVERALWVPVNSTVSSLSRAYDYMIDTYDGATKYYLLWNGTTGKLDGYNTSASVVLETAIGAGNVSLHLARSTFTINSFLSVENNTLIDGEGPGSIIELGNNYTQTRGIINVRNNCTLQNLVYDGRKDYQWNATGDQDGILVCGDHNRILNVKSQNAYRGEGFYLSHSNSCIVSNCIALNNGGDGFAADDSFYNTFSSNYASGSASEALDLVDSQFNTFTGLVGVNGLGAGCFLRGDTSYNVLSDSIFSYNAGHGIRVYDTAHGNRVDSNVVAYNTLYGIEVYNCNENIISNNDVFNNTLDGIRLRNADNCTVSDNKVKRNGDTGIRVTEGSDFNLIQDNYVSESSWSSDQVSQNIAVDTTSLYNVIEGNSARKGELAAGPAYGVLVNTGCNYTIIRDNDLRDSGKQGTIYRSVGAFYCICEGNTPYNVETLLGIIPTSTGWDNPFPNLKYATDGTTYYTTGWGNDTAGAWSEFGVIQFNFGRKASWTIRGIIGYGAYLIHPTSAAIALYWSLDGSSWYQWFGPNYNYLILYNIDASGGAVQRELAFIVQVPECQYIRLIWQSDATAGVYYGMIREIQAETTFFSSFD